MPPGQTPHSSPRGLRVDVVELVAWSHTDLRLGAGLAVLLPQGRYPLGDEFVHLFRSTAYESPWVGGGRQIQSLEGLIGSQSLQQVIRFAFVLTACAAAML